MARILTSLQTGDWLTKDRLLVYPSVILAMTLAATVYLLVTGGGVLPNGSPFGSDFVSFWVAAREAVAGRPETPYLAGTFAGVQNEIFKDGNFYAFYYPPHYLAYLLPLGLLRYYPALALWALAGFAAAAFVVTRIVGHRFETFLITLAFPASFLTVAHGQNAFLSAALFGGALMVMRTRPVLAGVLFGLLTFKPQLGLLIPFALLAGAHWRTILSAGMTTLVVAAVSALLFGTDVWTLFMAQASDATATLREGYVGWNKMISTYAMLRVTGLGDDAAMTAQFIVSLGVLATVWWSWRPESRVAFETRAALLLTGALLATPFGLNYDLFILAPAIAFAVAHGMARGFVAYQKTVLAIVYISPVTILALMSNNLNFAPIVLALMFGQLAGNALQDARRGGLRPMPAGE